jgi:phosphatidylserine/phosphatidylglycerophosphate/cardiolipin synthase-like enzyme
MMKHKRTALLLLPLLLLFGVYVFAAQGDPEIFFTDNIAATGPTLTITVMEQELLDRLNAAASSIDVAIYSLSRISVRDALIAAHSRGVTVRVVADDDAYAEAEYNRIFKPSRQPGFHWCWITDLPPIR